MWTPDGNNLYFMSDRGGAQNLWTTTLSGKSRQVTKFTNGRVLWPSIGYDGKAIVFEHDFGIWQLDTKSGEAFAVPITLLGASSSPASAHLVVNQFSDLALSPDGKKIGLIGHGEVFAASARDGGEALRVTSTPGPEAQVSWSPDSSQIVFVSERDAVNHVFLYDFAKRTEKQLTREPASDQSPRFSPDGKMVAYLRDRKELRVMDLDNNREHLAASGYLGGGFGSGSFTWSPDSKWLAFSASGDRSLRNIYVVAAAGGGAKQISFLANTNAGGLQWSPDGKYILYSTGQRTETPQIARIDMMPLQPQFTEEKFEELFKPDAPRGGKNATEEKKPVKPVDIEFDHIRYRSSLIPIGLEVTAPQISPDGKWLLITALVGAQSNLYLYPMTESQGAARDQTARQLTSTPGAKSHAQFSPDSKEVYFLEAGRVQAITVDTHVARTVNVNADLDVDFAKEKIAVFEQAWAGQRDGFYDPKMHGVDWNAVRSTYRPLIEACRTPDEMRRLLRMMVGELNASHSGISAPSAAGEARGGPRGVVGQLGLRFDRAEYESSGKLIVTEVLPQSPGDAAKLKAGDELRAVDGVKIAAGTNLDELLQYRIGKRVTLDVNGKEITVRPVASLADQIYRKWVEDNRAYVARISNGRLGYVHIRDMSEQSLTQFYLDLDADNRAKDGVVIDIRNNNGGFVNAYALDVLTRRPYMTMTGRGAPAGPARTMLGQRSLELPTILVVNQHSLSDAEDFTEGYRTLKLGKVVGEPTAGWIIYTGAMELVDGSIMRMPGTLITGADGKNMENNPRPVDFLVKRPVGESYANKDSQLDVAVKELIAQIPGR